MHFGLDGKLYVGVGENANRARSQDLDEPFGKLLRFNDDGTIPADNPFFNTQAGLARAIWAYGLRNPFTFAVQPVTGRIHINDVGENTWEEINVGAARRELRLAELGRPRQRDRQHRRAAVRVQPPCRGAARLRSRRFLHR